MSTSRSPILVINNGSSSLKFSILDPKSEALLSSGIAEAIGTEQGLLKLVDLEQVKHEEKLAGADHRSALLRVIEILSKKGRFGNRCKTERSEWQKQ
jgi:acetate kinase